MIMVTYQSSIMGLIKYKIKNAMQDRVTRSPWATTNDKRLQRIFIVLFKKREVSNSTVYHTRLYVPSGLALGPCSDEVCREYRCCDAIRNNTHTEDNCHRYLQSAQDGRS